MTPAGSYSRALAAATSVINQADPLGLLATGAPDDEYDSEIREVARLAVHAKNEGELVEAMDTLFHERLGTPAGQRAYWRPLAHDLLRLYNGDNSR